MAVWHALGQHPIAYQVRRSRQGFRDAGASLAGMVKKHHKPRVINAEIATRQSCSVPTVEPSLASIRRLLKKS